MITLNRKGSHFPTDFAGNWLHNSMLSQSSPRLNFRKTSAPGGMEIHHFLPRNWLLRHELKHAFISGSSLQLVDN